MPTNQLTCLFPRNPKATCGAGKPYRFSTRRSVAPEGPHRTRPLVVGAHSQARAPPQASLVRSSPEPAHLLASVGRRSSSSTRPARSERLLGSPRGI